MPDVLNDDGPDASVTLPDGRIIRNLDASEYTATYDDPGTTGGHEIPADILDRALRDAK